MVEGLFSFGEDVLGFVAPVFGLFKEEGFAPLLAFAMLAFTVLLGSGTFFFSILPGRISISKALAAVKGIKSKTDFTARFEEINAVFEKTPPLKHGWHQFCETLIKPDQQDQTQVIRNTIRPNFYLNTNEVESKLHLRMLHFVSNLLVGIGLLLTFIGLVAALTFATCGISDSITGGLATICGHTGKAGQLDAAIKDLLHAASLKFWTSVAGLGCSLMLRVFYEIQHSRIRDMLQKINAGIERGLQFVTPEYLAIEHLREAREQSTAMKRFSQDLAMSLAKEIQIGFTSALSPVHDSLKDIGTRITGGIGDAIKGAAGSEMQQLAQNMGSIVESLNASRTEMDGVGATFRIAMEQAAEAMKAASGETSGEMSRQLQDVMTTLAEESRKQALMFDDSMKRLLSVVDQAGENAGGTVEKAANNLASGMNGVSDGVRDAATVMAERMTHLSAVMQSIEERMTSHVRAMEALTGRAQDTEKAMGETSRHLSEAALPMTQATTKIASTAEQLTISVQTAQRAITDSHQNLMSLAGKMSEVQNILQKSWENYDKRFAGVDTNLEEALKKIVDHVASNLLKMKEFVDGMDSNLGRSITIFSDSLNGLADTAETFEEASSKLLKATDRIAA